MAIDLQIQRASFCLMWSTERLCSARAMQRLCESVMMSGRDDSCALSFSHEIASSIAEHSSSKELVKGAPLASRRSLKGGSAWTLITAAAPPDLQPSTADPSVKMLISEAQFSIALVAAVRIDSWLARLSFTPSRLEKIETLLSCSHGGLDIRGIGCLLSAASGMWLSDSSVARRAKLLLWFLGLNAEFHVTAQG